MNSKFLLDSIVGLYLSVIAAAVVSAEPLKIASIDWCPQLCQDQEAPGYVADIVARVFEGSPYTLEVKTYPWTRAILMVRSGRAHALLSPTKDEAPNLLYPSSEVGTQSMCFFTVAESRWRYSGVESLQGMNLGIARDTSIFELNEYSKRNPAQVQTMPYDHSYITKSLKKISAGRIDAFLFTRNSVIYDIAKLELQGRYRLAGCLTKANIYMGFSPEKSQRAQVEKMMRHFDERMSELKKSDQIKQILNRYGLENWAA